MELGVFEGLAHGLAQNLDAICGRTRRQEKGSTHQSENPEQSDHSALDFRFRKSFEVRNMSETRMFLALRNIDDSVNVDKIPLDSFAIST